ncbi:RhuM family protein [Paenibacillus polymyxa]|uniref:RhuM family protein n=1 Tax=Paenibacillus polymyxa TaxID=1406 RepID=UPI0018C873B3
MDAIISVGYRVNSQKATKFRIWATDVLKDYIQKGLKIDVERMKQGEHVFSKNYFIDEFLTFNRYENLGWKWTHFTKCG